MNKTVNATACTKAAFLAHPGTRFEIVRYWDGTCYVNRSEGDMPLETPQVPEFTTYGEIRNAYARVFGINLPKVEELAFDTSSTRKRYAYAIV